MNERNGSEVKRDGKAQQLGMTERWNVGAFCFAAIIAANVWFNTQPTHTSSMNSSSNASKWIKLINYSFK